MKLELKKHDSWNKIKIFSRHKNVFHQIIKVTFLIHKHMPIKKLGKFNNILRSLKIDVGSWIDLVLQAAKQVEEPLKQCDVSQQTLILQV